MNSYSSSSSIYIYPITTINHYQPLLAVTMNTDAQLSTNHNCHNSSSLSTINIH